MKKNSIAKKLLACILALLLSSSSLVMLGFADTPDWDGPESDAGESYSDGGSGDSGGAGDSEGDFADSGSSGDQNDADEPGGDDGEDADGSDDSGAGDSGDSGDEEHSASYGKPDCRDKPQ